MKRFAKLLALLLALVMTVSVMAACSGNNTTPTDGTGSADATQGGQVSTDGPQYGGHLNIRSASRPTGLDPITQINAWKYQWKTLVYDSILMRDGKNNIVPGVCDYELSEDQLHLKLWVRDGYVFSGDYGAVDIYDIEASFKRCLNKYSSCIKYIKPLVSSITIENDGEKDILHVVFKSYHEKTMYYIAAYQGFFTVMPKEICEKYATAVIVNQIEDAVGTGPYVFTDYQDSVLVSVAKREDYVPVENTTDGMSTTKHGYLDSMTFYYNGNDASAAMATLSGDYDVTEVIPLDYKQMAEQQGLKLTVLPSNQRTVIFFNTMGTNNLCAKYPSLRKAVLAAIDYESFLNVITDGSQKLDGENSDWIMTDTYATDAFKTQDYYGASNQEVVDKYMAAAREEGYTGEPLQIVFSNRRTDIPTLLTDAMENCGIAYQLTTMEEATYTAFIGDPANNWDFYFTWATTVWSPGVLSDDMMVKNYRNEEKDAIWAKMQTMLPESEEYMQLWDQLTTITAEGCYLGYMGAIDWWWWHPETLVINENNSIERNWFNAYWTDPENHPAP